MKKLILLAIVIFLGGTLAIAQPTTEPSSPITKVLIVPFKQVGDTTSHGWVMSAIQENLMSDVAGSPVMEAVALNHPLANVDKPNALKAAKDVGASIVVLGSYQFSDNQLRVTGQAVDADSGKMLATLQATGPVADLFKIEDTLGAELSGALPQPPSNLPQVTYGQAAETAAPYNTAAPNTTATQEAYPYTTAQPYVYPPATYAYPYSGYYDAGYPYYDYGYSPFYVGIGVPYFGYWGGFHGHFYGGGFHGGGHFYGGGHFGGGHFGGGRR